MGIAVIRVIGKGGRSNYARRPKMQDITISPINNAKWHCMECGTVYTKNVKSCKFCGCKEKLKKVPTKVFKTGSNNITIIIEDDSAGIQQNKIPVKLTKQQERVIRWYNRDWTIFQISEKIGITKSKVSEEIKFLRQNGYIN